MNESDLELYGIVGKMFREIRDDNGYTLERVSEYLNIAPKSLQRYECGERKIKMETIKSLCIFYNMDCSAFMKEAKKRFIGETSLEPKANIPMPKGLQTTKNDFIMSDLEKEIIIKFRQLGSEAQDMVLKMMGIEEKREESARMA